jgi:hypothetical protein
VRTTEELNGQTEKELRGQVKELVQAYEKINGGGLFGRGSSSFSSSPAMEGHYKKAAIRGKIQDLMASYLERNAPSAGAFIRVKEELTRVVGRMIDEEASGKLFVFHKVDYEEAAPLADLIKQEFLGSFEQIDPKNRLVETFVKVAENEPNFIAAIRKGVDNEILPEKTAERVIEERVPVVFNSVLEKEGLKKAEEAEETFVNEAVDAGFIDEAQRKEVVAKNTTATVDDLAKAAAKDLQEKQKKLPQVVIDQAIVEKAEELALAGKLPVQKQNEFVAKTKDALEAVKDEETRARDAEAEVENAKIQRDLEEQEQIRAEAAERVEKARNQELARGKFLDLLSIIEKRQNALNAIYDERDLLEQEIQTITKRNEELQNRRVEIKGSEKTLFEAEKIYHKEVLRIARSETLNRAERLSAFEGFDKETVELIQELQASTKILEEKLAQSDRLARLIKEKDTEIMTLIPTYDIYAKHNKKFLEQENRKMLVEQEHRVLVEAQSKLNLRYNRLFHVRFQFGSRKEKVNEEVAANRQIVEEILAQEKAAEEAAALRARAEEPVAPPQPALSFWNRLYQTINNSGSRD